MILYATLTGPLLGNYIAIKCVDETHARLMLNGGKLKSLWCGIYTDKQILPQIDDYNLVQAKLSQCSLFDDCYMIEEQYKVITGKNLFEELKKI